MNRYSWSIYWSFCLGICCPLDIRSPSTGHIYSALHQSPPVLSLSLYISTVSTKLHIFYRGLMFLTCFTGLSAEPGMWCMSGQAYLSTSTHLFNKYFLRSYFIPTTEYKMWLQFLRSYTLNSNKQCFLMNCWFWYLKWKMALSPLTLSLGFTFLSTWLFAVSQQMS